MPSINLILDGDRAFPELYEQAVRGEVYHLGNDAPPVTIALLKKGMLSGKSSLCIRVDLPDGKTVLAETSLALFLMAAKAIAAKCPDEAKEIGFP